jgi:outer membrane protein OmpA-like peptidoglycan-associated protein
MRSNNKLTVLLIVFLLFVSFHSVFGQQGSFYLSAGYNSSWYRSSTIHVEQSELGNNYDLSQVKGNNKTNSTISPLLLNYRLGFYCNEWQDIGLELSYDPVRYTVVDGSTLNITGLYNNQLNTHQTMSFSRKGGAYYYFDGLNLILVNFVKRWGIYRSNSKKISVDVLGKGGVGPVLPNFHSKLPVNPTDNSNFTWAGWNFGGEAAARVTLYRYGFVELAGKYDYAMLDAIEVYQGKVIASVGFTFPTTRMNPLFLKGRKVVTLLPWFQHKDELGEGSSQKPEIAGNSMDSLGGVPEFGDILDKSNQKYNLDSMAAIDSAARVAKAVQDSIDHVSTHKKRRRRHKGDVVDSVVAPIDSTIAVPPVTDSLTPPSPAPDTVKAQPVPVPEPPKEEIKEETKKILKEAIEGVNFESSKDIIQKSSYVILDKVVKLLKDNPGYKLQINGHTDSKGSATFNKTLSQKRAIAVKKYLTTHGIAGSRLKTAGYGGERPIADNETDAGKLKNRRVEFIIE